MARRVIARLGLLALASVGPLMAAENVHLSVDASKLGPKIDRNIFGQFAENLGHGLYEGIWVGHDSSIHLRISEFRRAEAHSSEGSERQPFVHGSFSIRNRHLD